MPPRITILLLFLFNYHLVGQTETSSTPHDVPERVFETLSQEIDYSKTRKTLSVKKSNRLNTGREKEDIRPSSFPRIPIGLFEIVAYLAIFILVAFILYSVFLGVKIDKKINYTEVDLSLVENIDDIDADDGYEQALNSGNYRLAIRMQFIKALQHLTDAALITWTPEKTNRHYLAELRSHRLYVPFKDLAHIYEWVWYGNTPVNLATFEPIDQKFKSLLSQDIG